MTTIIDLNGEWRFAEAGPAAAMSARGQWKPATVPGCVHLDLLNNGDIPDPFYGRNETKVQWVEERDWIYRRGFELSEEELLSARSWELVCEGLDTVAEISVNGVSVGSADNMFHEHRFPVKKALKAGGNEIRIRFRSPETVCRERYRAHELNDDPDRAYPWSLRRAYLRKAQYSFGWDWGPRLATSGIWRPIYLHGIGDAVVDGVRVWTTPTRSGGASVAIDADVRVLKRGRYRIEIRLERNGETVERALAVDWNRGRRTARATLFLKKADLWWPRGYGEQPLYDLVLILRREEEGRPIVDTWADRIGIREIELDRTPDSGGDGERFVFRVNGKKVFCRGANWVPPDSFLPRADPQRYRRLIRMAADANMNMLRVWGGGVYEDDAFYEACDEEGILVWQDFMFACAPYPETGWFAKSVETEAESVVRRLRNHPSLAIWCGNNENDWGYRSWGWAEAGWAYGGAVYHEVLPRICGDLDPTRPYWPSSPFGGEDPNSEGSGDRHNWGIWSVWEDYTAYRRDHGRFLSEFGFQAPACKATLDAVLPREERHSLSAALEWHEKQGEGIERLFRFLAAHLPMPRDFSEFVYLTQINQADAIRCGVDHWRRLKFDTAGTLFWQFNDCWPVVSWSCIDAADRPKALYYAARRFFAPLRTAWIPDDKGRLEAWAVWDGRGRVDVEFEARWLRIDGKVLWKERRELRLGPGRARRVVRLPHKIVEGCDPARHLAVAVLRRDGGEESRDIAAMVPFKHLRFDPPNLEVVARPARGGRVRIRVRSDGYAKAVELHAPGYDAEWSDNFFDLLPRESRTVTARPAAGTDPERFARRIRARAVRPAG